MEHIDYKFRTYWTTFDVGFTLHVDYNISCMAENYVWLYN